jgi:hypothetical protein
MVARASTPVGNLDGDALGVVDQAGMVALAGRGWSLDWWIGADDRWHRPAQEATLRQGLVGASPVVETRVRVPGGDAVQRVYAARGPSGEDALVVEVQNGTTLPFALALSLRGRIGDLELRGSTVLIDNEVVMELPGPPGRVALGTATAGDATDEVLAGRATERSAGAVHCPEGLATGALLFPVAHSAALRVVLPVARSGRVDPRRLPSADQVASGWAVQSRRGARFDVPDLRWQEAITASIRYLLLASHEPRLASALDLMGFADEAGAALLADPVATARTDTPGAMLHAVAWHWYLTRDHGCARDATPLVAALVGGLGGSEVADDDRALGHAALPLAAAMLEAAGESLAASDVRALMRPTPPCLAPPDPAIRLATASSTWTWCDCSTPHDLTANAALLADVRRMLVLEQADGVALSPVVPDAWLGRGWEVHDAPTGAGRLSYAVRWHGDRPALLWELVPHADLPATRLSAPELDRGWSTLAPHGEALLAPRAS